MDRIEIPLIRHENYPNMILRARVMATENIQEFLLSELDQQIAQLNEKAHISKIWSDAVAAFHDFERYGSLHSLEQAVSKFEAVAEMTPKNGPGQHRILSNLGTSLFYRFARLGKVADINNSIEYLEMSARLVSDEDREKPTCLNNLGNSLQGRFKRFGDLSDLDSAITRYQSAVNLTPDGGPQKAMCLSNLGLCLRRRFERLGDISNLDTAITRQQSAVSLTPDGHPDKPLYLSALGGSLRCRFEKFRDLSDIDTAIIQHQSAVNLTPDGHPDKPMYLSNLGVSLHGRFKRSENLSDLDSAITQGHLAVSLIPDGHPDKPAYLNNLGFSLQSRFRRLGNLSDLDSAITQSQLAVSLSPDGHPLKPASLSNLGMSLESRFERVGDISVLQSAIDRHQSAINLTPDGHPDKTSWLNNLGTVLGIRFFRFFHARDAEAAITHLSTSAQSSDGPPMIRIDSARKWASIAFATKNYSSSLRAYECTVGLMPVVAWLGLPIRDRHEHLVQISEVARDAAEAAITCEEYEKALEWLEQGRSIVWNQILQLRTPVEELREVNSGLADRLLQVSRLLDHGVEEKGIFTSIEGDAQRYRALTMEWESILKEIRSLSKFEDFLKPLRASQLRDAAQNGPVVVLNVSEKRCDALVLVPGIEDVIHIPLPDLTLKRATELQDELKGHLYSRGIRLREGRAAQKWADENNSNDCKHILAELWDGLVKPVLDSLAFSVGSITSLALNLLTIQCQPHPDELPRIWWCPTGPLTFLPIHAAGIYDLDSTGSQISDYVISSYVPTLSSLLQSTKATSDSTFKLLSVIQPSAPGASHIPNTKQELECIVRRLGNRDHVILDSHEATKKTVTKAMAKSNWAHLACHGSQRQDEPTKSGLILEDGHLTLEDIIKLDLPNAEFAYLSACQTTTGEETLSDEAVHIAGGMLLAGYRGVVATMWSIEDDIAPEVADEFYRHIMEDKGRPDNRKAAEALHYSIQKLRKKKDVPLTSWIPFVHMGV
jgi:tetratricopeptide (TPR) repeat protein